MAVLLSSLEMEEDRISATGRERADIFDLGYGNEYM